MTNHELSTSPAHAFWEPFYGEQVRWAPGRVNPVMAANVEPLTAGRALDLGCGEGGDAVWLAQHGWHVTAVDVSGIALERASSRAKEAGVDDLITWEQHDLEQTFPVGEFDLVSAQFLQSPIEFDRDHVLHSAASAVAPGGLLLIVDHAAAPSGAQDHAHHRFPTPDEVVESLSLASDAWRIDRAEVVEREGTRPNGEVWTFLDSIVAAARLADEGR